MLRVKSLDRRNVKRRRQIIHDRVKQGLNSLVFESCSAENRNYFKFKRRLADRFFQEILGQFFSFKRQFHKRVVKGGDGINKLFPPLFRIFHEFGTNVLIIIFGAELFVMPDYFLHFNQIHYPSELVFRADGQA